MIGACTIFRNIYIFVDGDIQLGSVLEHDCVVISQQMPHELTHFTIIHFVAPLQVFDVLEQILSVGNFLVPRRPEHLVRVLGQEPVWQLTGVQVSELSARCLKQSNQSVHCQLAIYYKHNRFTFLNYFYNPRHITSLLHRPCGFLKTKIAHSNLYCQILFLALRFLFTPRQLTLRQLRYKKGKSLLGKSKIEFKSIDFKKVYKIWLNGIDYINMMFIKNIIEHVCCSEEELMSEPRHVLCVDKTKDHYHSGKESVINEGKVENKGEKKKYVSPFPTAEEPQKMYSFNSSNGKKYLLIDLDRTLIYYDEEKGFIMRPHLNRFLRAMDQYYNIYIFTAATKTYLDLMLEYLKQNKAGIEHISGFLTRQNCVPIQTNEDTVVFVKDINVIENCQPSKIVVVDDLPISYCLNPENAVPILPFQGQPLDNHLFFLSQTLTEIKDYNDVRDYIRGRYIFSSLSPTTSQNYFSLPKQSNQSFLTNSTYQ